MTGWLIRYHIGMGADPHDMIADNYARGVIPQAYSPLNHGSLARNVSVCVQSTGGSPSTHSLTAWLA